MSRPSDPLSLEPPLEPPLQPPFERGGARALNPLQPLPRTSDALLGFAAGMGGMLLGLAMGLVPAVLLDLPELIVLGLVLSGVCGLGGLWLVLGVRAGWSLWDVGLRRSRSHHLHLLWQVPLLFAANLALTALVAEPLGVLDLDPGPSPAPTPGADPGPTPEADPLLGLEGGVRWWLVLPGAAMLGIVLPLVEEVVFRRLLLDWLGSWLPMGVAGVLVMVTFAVMHVAPPAILYVGGLGVCLVLLRWWHGTLWAPLVLHMANNLLVAAIAVAVALA